MAMRFIHVLSHQDKKSNKPLTLPEQLNIDCDVSAAQLPPPDNPNQLHQNPRTDVSHPHLCIKGQIIIRQLQATLHDAATQEKYFQYLQEKFQWTMPPLATIHWQVIQLALRRFNCTEHTTITKFIHKWLPLQDCHHVHSASSNHLCPSCHSAPETVTHFLSCPHPDHQALWKELDANLLKHFLCQQITSNHYDLFKYGLLQGHTNLISPDPQITFTEQLQALCTEQSHLGWKQLYYGQLIPQ